MSEGHAQSMESASQQIDQPHCQHRYERIQPVSAQGVYPGQPHSNHHPWPLTFAASSSAVAASSAGVRTPALFPAPCFFSFLLRDFPDPACE